MKQPRMLDEQMAGTSRGRLGGGVGTAARRLTKAAVVPMGLATRRRRGDLTILLYHRVGAGLSQIDVAPRTFERQLDLLVRRDRVLTIDHALDTASPGGIAISFDDGLRDFHEVVVPALVQRGIPAILYLATGLVHGEGPSDVPDRQRLTWSHLRESVGTGLVTVGSHTHRHADLGRASEREADEEMRRSKELIEDRLGVACRHFAYPWAVASPEAQRAARRLFASAALDAWRTNRRGHIEPHRLGRTPVLRADGRIFFPLKRAGFLDGEALIYRLLRRGPWGRP